DYLIGIISTQTTVPVSSVTAYEQAMSQGRGGQTSQEMSRDLSASGAPFPNGSGYAVGNSLLLQSGSSGRSAITPAPNETGAVYVYQPLFYPAATVSTQGTPIRITSGEERLGVDLQLRL